MHDGILTVSALSLRSQLKVGQVGANSYVPEGLTLDQYKKIRAEEVAKKQKNYEKNSAKAGKFLGFDEFYLKRGTDTNGAWLKDPTKGHRMAKTKYDFSGEKDEQKSFESFSFPSIFKK